MAARDDPISHFTPSSSPIVLDSGVLSPDSGQNLGGSLPNDGVLAGENGNDSEYGFFRPEFRQNPLVGTIDFYERHVFLCYKGPHVWPAHIVAAEFDRVPRLLAAALAAKKTEVKRKTRLTICEGRDGTETSNGDVLIFPDMIRYRKLTHFDVDTFVEEVLVKETEWLPGTPEKLSSSYVFVCAHGSRDKRCGVCGPPLVKKFKEEIEARGMSSLVSVSPCSHIGGHKYAGNVIIFVPNNAGEVTGHWYGYVSPEDVPILLDQHIGKGEIVDQLWRGQMGLSAEDQKKAQDLRLQINGKTETTDEIEGENLERETKPEEQMNGSQLEPVVGCCQGEGSGSSCCQDVGQEEQPKDLKAEEVGPTKVKANGAGPTKVKAKGACSRKICVMPSWFESWEREDTYAVLAVIGAAASVALAYQCYRRLN
ncbi:hypothetical protein AMTRI_Chr10g232300 [Amborella trichopoda]|uniref:Uncharacterized protein n=1 Tax=Amborella trichopoda TaxID=13333 RepID=U5DCS0_AMBTC|nr:uncharacterized protein LOC18447594 [Amborella trichopoda]ERN19217.1 hypothetical protein AMTR_s00061p00194250 [Amborella trichopoda]|eukprot:XP_006857750.1 uncharacterized protein LOC18447594 [Amborella trichopoda]